MWNELQKSILKIKDVMNHLLGEKRSVKQKIVINFNFSAYLNYNMFDVPNELHGNQLKKFAYGIRVTFSPDHQSKYM